jgi:hypothetical protein
MAFNPDEYLQSSGNFNPDEFLGITKEELKKKPVTSMSERFAQGFKDPFLGGAQRAIEVGKAPNAFVTNPLINLMNVLGQKSFDVGLKATGQKPAAEQIQQDIAQTRQNYVPPEGVDWARMGGNIVNPTTFMSPTNAATSLGKKILTNAAVGSGYSALAPTMSPEELQSNLSTGAVTGGLFSAGTSALGRIVSPNASTDAQMKIIKDMGITPTLGQTLGKRWNAYEEKLTSFPLIGDIINNARTKNEEKFRTGLFNTILSNVDEKLPTTPLKGRDPLNYTKDKIQSSYKNLLDKLGAIQIDGTFVSQADDLATMIQKSGMSPEKVAEFNYLLKPIQDAQSNKGYITSDSYKMIESELSKQIKKLNASNSTFDIKLSGAASQLKDNLYNLLERHSSNLPKIKGNTLAEELQRTNKAWAMYKRTEKASGAQAAEVGDFTPSQFARAVSQLEPSKSRYAQGSALLQEVSDAAKSVIGNKISNANPYVRSLGTIGGTAAAITNLPNYLMAAITTYGLYNPISQKLINKAITERPDIAPAIKEFINQQSPKALSVMPSLLGKNNE